MFQIQRFQEGRSRQNILKICYEFSWSYWKSIFKSVKISRFSPKYSAISSFLSQVCCLVTPTESFVLKIFSKYFGGIGLPVTTAHSFFQLGVELWGSWMFGFTQHTVHSCCCHRFYRMQWSHWSLVGKVRRFYFTLYLLLAGCKMTRSTKMHWYLSF